MAPVNHEYAHVETQMPCITGDTLAECFVRLLFSGELRFSILKMLSAEVRDAIALEARAWQRSENPRERRFGSRLFTVLNP